MFYTLLLCVVMFCYCVAPGCPSKLCETSQICLGCIGLNPRTSNKQQEVSTACRHSFSQHLNHLVCGLFRKPFCKIYIYITNIWICHKVAQPPSVGILLFRTVFRCPIIFFNQFELMNHEILLKTNRFTSLMNISLRKNFLKENLNFCGV